jgi:hypothetical protein
MNNLHRRTMLLLALAALMIDSSHAQPGEPVRELRP